MSRVLFVVAPKDFRDEELFEPKAELERAGHTCIIASREAGTCLGSRGRRTVASVALRDVDATNYSAVVFVGGPGARTYFDDSLAFAIARDAFEADLIVGAICVAPVILASAGLLADKRATVFDTEVHALRAGGAHYQGPGVVIDGKLITASGPDEAIWFGKALVRALRATPLREARPN